MQWKSDEVALDNAIRMGDYSGETVIDPETPLEELFSIPLAIGLCLFGMGLLGLFLNMLGVMKGGGDYSGGLAWKGFWLGLLGVGVRNIVDVHYRLNTDLQRVTLCRRIFGWRWRKYVCSFQEVQSLQIDSTTYREKRGRSDVYDEKHRYGLLMNLHSGKTVRLLDNRFESYSMFYDRALRVAQDLGVGMIPGTGSSSSGCLVQLKAQLEGCGCLLLGLLVFGAVFGTAARKEDARLAQERAASLAIANEQAAKAAALPSQALYVTRLKAMGFKNQAAFFEGGSIDVNASYPVWEVICKQQVLSDKKAPPNMATALAHTPSVIKSLSKKLNPGSDGAPDPRVKLHIEMDFRGEEADFPVLARNIDIGIQRMAMGSPRGGAAMMRLLVFPAAKKGEVRPEDQGFLLILPSKVPVDPAQLGVKKKP